MSEQNKGIRSGHQQSARSSKPTDTTRSEQVSEKSNKVGDVGTFDNNRRSLRKSNERTEFNAVENEQSKTSIEDLKKQLKGKFTLIYEKGNRVDAKTGRFEQKLTEQNKGFRSGYSKNSSTNKRTEQRKSQKDDRRTDKLGSNSSNLDNERSNREQVEQKSDSTSIENLKKQIKADITEIDRNDTI